MASNSSNSNTPSDSGSTTGNDTAIAIVLIVVGGIVTVIIAFLIYKCVKKCLRRRKRVELHSGTGSSIDEGTTPINLETSGAAVGFSQVELESMDRFLAEILQERPIKFTSFHLKSFTENFSEKIGSGGFGVVYKGQLPNGMPIAVKVLNGNMDKRAEEQFMAEVGTIGRTYHLHLFRLYGFCFEPTVKALVYEYMENGSLEKHLFSSEKKIGFDKLYEIPIGTAKGIRYLHEECQQRIVHYDIKPGNVLLTVSFSPKVADFGLAKLCDRENTHFTITGTRGTPGYAAPELWMPLPVTHKCDVYSFGMLLFEIIGRTRNFDLELQSKEWYPRWVWQKFEIDEMDVVLSVADIEDKYREKAERICKVALWCVQYRPDERPTMSSVVRMLEGEQAIEDPADPFRYMVAHNLESIATSSTGTTADYSSGAARASSSL
ncbi:Protein kinase family protein [Rhynchospora pubera]|uniref:Protein kinase family protein n=1 Tax=Rhynchospora pubera TaxID=906938 RepID=A0AAV8G959_9POAL|nr:Protein kinase family protein [Rhynchospora pubera]KAJ4802012.1 Protein kinase family protein [Rhynchospora pubera]